MNIRRHLVSAVLLIAAPASADTLESGVFLPGGFSLVGSHTFASVIAQPTAATVQFVGAVQLDPGFLCVEADDLGVPGDINHDGFVNGIDIGYVLADWGTYILRSDINRDGVVNGSDLGILLAYWG